MDNSNNLTAAINATTAATAKTIQAVYSYISSRTDDLEGVEGLTPAATLATLERLAADTDALATLAAALEELTNSVCELSAFASANIQ